MHRSDNLGMGINIEEEEGRKRVGEIIEIVGGEYAGNVYLRGFHAAEADATARNWLLHSQRENVRALGIKGTELDALVLAHENEVYDGDYIFEDAALTLLSTVSNVYYDGDRFVHLLDCGSNAYARVPMKMARYHRPQYALKADASLAAMLRESEVGGGGVEYEIVNDGEYRTLLVCNKELDVGGKVELVPEGCNATVNLYNYLIVVNDEKQTVDGIWTIDARGPGN